MTNNRNIFYIIILTCIIFILLTFFTAKQEAVVDGISSYGFPFTFYSYLGTKCNNCNKEHGFKLIPLLADIGLIAIFCFTAIQLKNKIFISAFTLSTICILTSCSEIKTSNAKQIYKHWADTTPPSDVNVLNGQYWQSSHWTKEYIIYLKLKPSETWWNKFIKQNSLSIDASEWITPTDAPKWFKPTANSVQFIPRNFNQGSRYFRDTITGVCFIYEIQL